jgi:hypothetical protein
MLKKLIDLIENFTSAVNQYNKATGDMKILIKEIFSFHSLTSSSALDHLINQFDLESMIALSGLLNNWGVINEKVRIKLLNIRTKITFAKSSINNLRSQLIFELTKTNFTNQFENQKSFEVYSTTISNNRLIDDVNLFIQNFAIGEVKKIISRIRKNIDVLNSDKYYLINILFPIINLKSNIFDFNELLKKHDHTNILEFLECLDRLLAEIK